MDIMHSEWKVRIENWLAVLKQELYRPIGEISFSARKTKEYLTPEQALQGDGNCQRKHGSEEGRLTSLA